MDFFNQTNGEDWVFNANWCTEKSLKEWHGVELNESDVVIGLRLENNNLRGYLPSCLGGLLQLEVLELGNFFFAKVEHRNRFTGSKVINIL